MEQSVCIAPASTNSCTRRKRSTWRVVGSPVLTDHNLSCARKTDSTNSFPSFFLPPSMIGFQLTVRKVARRGSFLRDLPPDLFPIS